MNTGTHRTNPLRMLLVTLLLLGIIAFLAIAISSGDPFWLNRGFTERPERVVVFSGGVETAYQAGDPGYEDLAGAIQVSLDQGVAHPSSVGLSEDSLRDAYGKYLTVEAIFAGPVKLHAPFNTHTPTSMLFLISGRHSEQPMVFMGENGRYRSNAPVLKTNEPLRAALQSLGYNLDQGE